MFRHAVQHATLFAAYQLSLLLGLLALPLAVLARQGGIRLPVGRLVERTRRAYEATRNSR